MDMYGFGIGAISEPHDGNSGGWFTGSLDEVSFYTSVLTQTTRHQPLPARHSAGATSPAPPADRSTPPASSAPGARYSTSTTLSIALAPGTDPSGIADYGRPLSARPPP